MPHTKEPVEIQRLRRAISHLETASEYCDLGFFSTCKEHLRQTITDLKIIIDDKLKDRSE